MTSGRNESYARKRAIWEKNQRKLAEHEKRKQQYAIEYDKKNKMGRYKDKKPHSRRSSQHEERRSRSRSNSPQRHMDPPLPASLPEEMKEDLETFLKLFKYFKNESAGSSGHRQDQKYPKRRERSSSRKTDRSTSKITTTKKKSHTYDQRDQPSTSRTCRVEFSDRTHREEHRSRSRSRYSRTGRSEDRRRGDSRERGHPTHTRSPRRSHDLTSHRSREPNSCRWCRTRHPSSCPLPSTVTSTQRYQVRTSQPPPEERSVVIRNPTPIQQPRQEGISGNELVLYGREYPQHSYDRFLQPNPRPMLPPAHTAQYVPLPGLHYMPPFYGIPSPRNWMRGQRNTRGRFVPRGARGRWGNQRPQPAVKETQQNP